MDVRVDGKESWAPKNWCFWTVVLKKTLESPLNFKEIQPVHPKGNSPEYSLERLMLKFQLFGHLVWGTESLERILMLGRIGGRRRRGRKRMRWLDGITDSVTWVWASSGSWWCTAKHGVMQYMGLKWLKHYWVTELYWCTRMTRSFSLWTNLSKNVVQLFT